MKVIAPERDPIVREGSFSKSNAREFTAELNDKAYDILSNGIYKYKIRAIVRELSTNAVDGHTLAGNTAPFDIHVPSTLDPRFIVRDYGTGLTDEQVQEIFTVYFKSTKTDSNDFNGSLGLGCKSPFAYTCQYTVESIVDGVKRGYIIYKDGGKPTYDTTYVTETSEPNGVIITVGCKQEDIKTWRSEILRVFQSFREIRPNFVNEELKVNYIDRTKKVNGIIFHNSNNYYETNRLYALMGDVVYPIDNEMFSDTMLNAYLQTSSSTKFIEFELGELNFQPSREELQLDKTTIDNIKKAVANRSKEIDEQYRDEFSKLVTTRDKLRWFKDLPATVSSHITRSKDKFFYINGVSMYSIYSTFEKYSDERRYYGSGLFCYDPYDTLYRLDYYGVSSNYRQTTKRIDVNELTKLSKDKLYVLRCNNQSSVLAKYIKPMMKEGILPKATYLLTIDGSNDMSNGTVQFFINQGMFEESEIVYLELGDYEELYKKYRKISMSKRPSNDNTKPKSPNVIKLTFDNGEYTKEDLSLSSKELSELSGYYLNYFKDEVFIENFKHVSVLTLDTLKCLHKTKSLYFNSIYLIRSSVGDKIVNNPEMVNFDEVAKQYISSIFKQVEVKDMPLDTTFLQWEHITNKEKELFFTRLYNRSPKGNPVGVMARKLYHSLDNTSATVYYIENPFKVAYDRFVRINNKTNEMVKHKIIKFSERNPVFRYANNRSYYNFGNDKDRKAFAKNLLEIVKFR